jgi:hypothetical protein
MWVAIDVLEDGWRIHRDATFTTARGQDSIPAPQVGPVSGILNDYLRRDPFSPGSLPRSAMSDLSCCTLPDGESQRKAEYISPEVAVRRLRMVG